MSASTVEGELQALKTLMATEERPIRGRSGRVNSTDKVVCLLYLLLRDTMPAGQLESIVASLEKDHEFLFSNGWLAEYAIDLRERLNG